MGDGPAPVLYPELVPPGRLATAVQAALEGAQARLRVEDPLGSAYAVVRQAQRSCQVMVARDERLFGSGFWDRGVAYGHLWAGDLTTLASAVKQFLQDRCGTADLLRSWPNITIPDAARAHEAGHLVDFTWSEYLSGKATTWPETVLAQVFKAAAGRERMRRLMPFTSMNRACFSTTTGAPYTDDCPMIEVSREGTCHVFAPGAQRGARPIFTGPVMEAVLAAEATMPLSIPAARDGVARDDDGAA